MYCSSFNRRDKWSEVSPPPSHLRAIQKLRMCHSFELYSHKKSSLCAVRRFRSWKLVGHRYRMVEFSTILICREI